MRPGSAKDTSAAAIARLASNFLGSTDHPQSAKAPDGLLSRHVAERLRPEAAACATYAEVGRNIRGASAVRQASSETACAKRPS
jgi:TolA-binding protein